MTRTPFLCASIMRDVGSTRAWLLPRIRTHNRQFCSQSTDFVEKLSRLGEGDVLLEKDEQTGVCVVTLDNPAKRTAMSPRMMVKFSQITSEIAKWKSGKVAILQGSNGTFCSGGDLVSVMRDIGSPSDGAKMCAFMQKTLHAFYTLPVVTVALLQGKAIGGGAELATACDFRLMEKDAEIGFVHKKLAVSTGWGGGTRLVEIVGRKSALHILLSGRLIGFDEALRNSLIDGSLSGYKDCVEYCKEWLTMRGYLDSNPEILQSLKTVVAKSCCLPTLESYEVEKDVFSSLWGGKLHKEALSKNQKHK